MTSNRCSICKIKVRNDFFECSCSPGNMYCENHRFPFNHNCSKDYKKEQSKQIQKLNPIVKPEKLIKL